MWIPATLNGRIETDLYCQRPWSSCAVQHFGGEGIFSKEELMKLRKTGAMLQGHPDMKDTQASMSTGSLGQGLSASNGMALAGKIDNKNYRVYALLGDGEMQEGQVWEAAMTAAHYKLDNLTVFIDNKPSDRWN